MFLLKVCELAQTTLSVSEIVSGIDGDQFFKRSAGNTEGPSGVRNTLTYVEA